MPSPTPFGREVYAQAVLDRMDAFNALAVDGLDLARLVVFAVVIGLGVIAACVVALAVASVRR